jgi:hypothetical protein
MLHCSNKLLGMCCSRKESRGTLVHVALTAEAFIRRGEFFRGQHAHHGVLGHGAQQAVRVEVALGGAFAEGDRHQGHEILGPFRPRAEGQARKVARADTDAFVAVAGVAVRVAEGKDEEYIRQLRRTFRKASPSNRCGLSSSFKRWKPALFFAMPM